MELDLGKLFIGGISWDTNEDRLREYFSSFGEVVEAVIMKDRTTGRARGFGFVVFADPAVAEQVVWEKHMIDGRMVEAKKAVPRDDQNITGRSNNSLHGSPGPGRTKKIFVGGLASTVTETEFKKYFDQFGTITDVVVMYDHNTQRPRGFGFITFDSEDAVDKVLIKTFHELNGKMVEVKKAVPKEMSPGPSMRSLAGGYNFGSLNRPNNFLNGYTQGYNPSSSIGSYGMRIDGRFSPVANGRNVFPSFAPGYGIDMNFEPGASLSYGGNLSFSNGVGFGRALNPYYNGNSNRYTSSPIGYGSGNNTSSSVLNSVARNLWGNGSLNYTTNSSRANSFIPSGSANLGGFGNYNLSWGDNAFGLGISSNDRNTLGSPSVNNSLPASGNGYERNFVDTYNNSSVYGDATWRTQSSELDESGPFGYGLVNASSDVEVQTSSGFIDSYSIANRQPNRGIAI